MKRWKLSILLVFLMLAIATSVDTRALSSQVQLNPICGRWLIVQVYAGAFTFPAKAILPDGAANPYIVYGGPDLVVDNYYCIYDPVVELISPPDRTKEGYSISQKITGWSTIQPAGGQPPSAEFDAWPQSGSAPLSVSMHIVSTNNISSCLWEYGDGTTGTSCDAYHDHVYTSAGSYTAKLTVTGPGGSNTMTRSNYITVTSAAVCYTLTKGVNPSNGGSIIAFPIPNCADGKYTAGTQLSLVATPLSGYQFTSWGGSLSGNANPATLIMDADKNVTANFNQSSFCSTVTEIPQTECEALIAFYNSTNGAGWSDNSNWLDTTSPCNWYGVTCNNNHVVQLVLPNNQLNGALPEQLSALTNLQTLSLYVNQLSGSIPPAVGSLTNLISLSLSDNQLSGSIPASLGSLSNLQLLHAHGNQFSGNIPTQLGYLTNLRELDLAKNQLSGSIPTQIGHLTKLENLGLGSNQLSGNIPTELGKLTKLVGINLSNNQLSGNLPAQVGDLINLDFLSIENNPLSGALPGSLINLNKLVHFWFNNTNLCEPGDSSFQSWLTRISDLNRTGVICTVPPTITPTPTRTPSATATPLSTSTPAATNSILGRVTDGHNNPLAGVFVALLDGVSNSFVVTSTTYVDGSYLLTGANQGKTYKIRVTLRDGNGNSRVHWGDNGILVYAQTKPFNFNSSQTSIVKDVDFSDLNLEAGPVPVDLLDDLATMYYRTREVRDFVIKQLGLQDFQPIAGIWGFAPGQNTFYSPNDKFITIASKNSKWGISPMNREWHENFHHLMNMTIGMPPLGGGENNHRGFNNPTTDDSWGEGWASFWPCVLGELYKRPHPELYILSPDSQISFEDNWQIWDMHDLSISREDFAIASLLWDLYDPENMADSDNIDLSLNTIWSVIGRTTANNSLNDMRDVYTAFQEAALTNEDNTSVTNTDIDQIFISHGFYADWNSNRNRESSEEVGWAGITKGQNPQKRRSTPELPNAYLKINVQNQNGEPIQTSSLLVEIHFDNSYYDYSYTVDLNNTVGGMLYLELPPTRTFVTAKLTLFGSGRSNPYTITNTTYWNKVINSTTGYAEEYTFVVSYPVYLPIVSKNP